MYMCLVLFVVSKIPDSTELLSCLVEMGVEYYLACIKNYISNYQYILFIRCKLLSDTNRYVRM